MVWHSDTRTKAGGRWRCHVRKRELDTAWYSRKWKENHAWREARIREIAERKMVRYDTDPVYRIEKLLRDSREARQKRLALRRQQLSSEKGG